MSKLSFVKCVWIVKLVLKGNAVARVVLAQKVNRSLVYQLVEKYKVFGWDGLKDHKSGSPETTLNQNAEIIIFDLRKFQDNTKHEINRNIYIADATY